MRTTPNDAACNEFYSASWTRRDALRAGALALTGLGLPELFVGRAAASGTLRGAGTRPATTGASGFGRAKSCIVIFQWGGPSQLDTWDPKPDAPLEIRGAFRAIETRVPGIRISEHFPNLASQTHRTTIIRSMTHDDPAHLSSAHRVLTGHLAPRPFSDAAGPSPQDSPHLGALVARLRPNRGVLPSSVTMPWTVAHPAAPGGRAPGQNAGWLGRAFDPFALEGNPNDADFRIPGLEPSADLAPSRLRSRRSLLEELDPASTIAKANAASSWNQAVERTLDMLMSSEARGAFRLDREDPRLRDRYGRHIHGQCLLLARRLVEAGVGLVTVNWHDDGMNFWDTHGDNFNQLKNRLMPPADQGFAALLDDLDARGLLDETLVVWVGEFGRTPRTTQGGSGREHWPRCYSAVLAGGGIARGRVFGASDRYAAYPSQDPVGPDDLGATILYALGIDPARELLDPLARPLRINTGRPLSQVFA